MSIPVIAFFNNKGGVGKTSLVHHLSWMYADMGYRTLAVDLDPQSNLTASFLTEDEVENLTDSGAKTVFGAIKPLKERYGDIVDPDVQHIVDPDVQHIGGNLNLVLGDMLLTGFEDALSESWPKCLGGDPGAFRVISAFWRIMQKAAKKVDAQLIIVDLGPNLGAINRSSLIASDYVVIPLTPDLYSIQGLQNLGPTLDSWRNDWNKILREKGDLDIELPEGRMAPVGYIVLRHSVRLDRPVKAFERWISRIPIEYRDVILKRRTKQKLATANDPNCLALLKDYRSLMPLAHEANKPIFHLQPADGAIGAHMSAVLKAKEDFAKLAKLILRRAKIN